MENTDQVSLGRKICLILVSVIFLLMSFSLMVNYIFILILLILALGLTIYLAFPYLKKFDVVSSLIYLIPVFSLALFYAIGNFSRSYVDVATCVMIPIVMTLFGVLGMLLFRIPKFEIKTIFSGIFIGLALVSLINMILTLYNYGPFHGIRYSSYYSYYDGTISKESLPSTAYALCGLTVKQVPIQYYLIFPTLSLGGFICFFVKNDARLWEKIVALTIGLIGLISIIFVISRITLFISLLSILFTALVCALFAFKIRPSNKVIEIVLIVVTVLLGVGFIFMLMHAQSGLTGLRDFVSSVPLLRYIFVSNRFMESNNLILNGFFSPDKLIGFPVLFDEFYETNVYPGYNIFTNQFMYAGIFGFIFMIIIVVMFIHSFLKVKDLTIDSRVNKYMPFFFIALFFIYSFTGDVSYIDEYEFVRFAFTPISPFFLMCIMFGGYYNALMNEGGNKNA